MRRRERSKRVVAIGRKWSTWKGFVNVGSDWKKGRELVHDCNGAEDFLLPMFHRVSWLGNIVYNKMYTRHQYKIQSNNSS